MGFQALFSSETGNRNAAFGSRAMTYNTTGGHNAAFGYNAANGNQTGDYNTALGSSALLFNLTGARNVAVGYKAGYAATGHDNILIGALNTGNSTDNGVIRIGVAARQNRAFLAGVSGVQTGSSSAAAVFIDGNGQLGTIQSSRVYKDDIRPMGNVSERLYALQPVTFRYKQAYDDGSRPSSSG